MSRPHDKAVDGSKIANITAAGVPIIRQIVGVYVSIASAEIPMIIGKGDVDIYLFHNRNTAWLIINFAMTKTCLRITSNFT